jgi:transposase InsO family protein
VLVELAVVEQRYRAVLEVLVEGATVTDVARRFGVTRQTVHRWLRLYASGGMAGLADRSSRPASCPHQIDARVEARIVELRRLHPGWGPRSIATQLGRDGGVVPGRSSIYRALVRHRLIEVQPRRRRRQDYQRWERARAMELWQMDVMGGVYLTDGTELKAVTGIDDHSRFCVCATLVVRATAKPVCDAFVAAMRAHGVPSGVLTDNGKVFTGRFGPGTEPVRFDRICHEQGIKHLLTRPFSPTTTGKIERLHKTMRAEHFTVAGQFDSIGDAQHALDAWVVHYNEQRPHQSIGDRSPIDRFRLAAPANPVEVLDGPARVAVAFTRRVTRSGTISVAGTSYLAGRWLAGEIVDVSIADGLVEISRAGVLCETHAQHHPVGRAAPRGTRPPGPDPLAAKPQPVTRIVDSTGRLSFAGRAYLISRHVTGRSVEVTLLNDTLEFRLDGELVKTSPIRHNRAKESAAFANPGGRPGNHHAVA